MAVNKFKFTFSNISHFKIGVATEDVQRKCSGDGKNDSLGCLEFSARN